MRYALHFDPTDLQCLYNYTDDLMHIHRQLAKVLQDNDCPLGVKIVETEAAIKALFDEDLLDTGITLTAKEERSKYAVKYAKEYNDVLVSAHQRVVTLFHECWGVLPSTDLDDYRSIGVIPLSLSEDFIAEALASTEAQANPVPSNVIKMDRYQTHASVPGGNKKIAVFVEELDTYFAQVRSWFRSTHVEWDKDDSPKLVEVPPVHTSFAERGIFAYNGKVYGFAVSEFELEGTSWAGYIEWYSVEEMQEMYAKAQQA
ncbi:MAG: hypothetical protein VXZ72_05245 [Chlamydiota bacterium]|nr:hypothetical protein [Chlamydiota bacterium]